MQIESVTDPGGDWDEFAESRPDCRLGHAAAWARILRDGYGLRVHCLIAREVTGRIAGIASLAELRNWRGRRELVSLPFLDAAGILAADAEAGVALREAALSLARDRGVTALELRQCGTESAGGPEEGGRVDLVLPLETGEDLQWKALDAKVRNQTRKAEREGLALSDAPSTAAQGEFYSVFCENMRDLGSPVHARRFFAAIAEGFGVRARFVVTRLGTRPVGGLVAVRFGAQVTVPWASTLRSERARCPNNQIYWEAIRWAIENGAREFDFGRSPRESGTHRFKLGWGARERALPWLRLTSGGQVLSRGSEPDSGGALLQRVSALWQRLPVPVASFLGSRVRRFFAN
jgi:FemAB-related protein (PEP-CTERM system-associated)